MKCKHENGWIVMDSTYLFVNNKGGVTQKRLFFSNDGSVQVSRRVIQKHVATCNTGVCSATRNVYIETKLIKMGRVKKR